MPPRSHCRADHQSAAAIARDAVASAAASVNAVSLNDALARAVALVTRVDGYINATEPFKLAKKIDAEPHLKDQLAAILHNCAEALRIASLLMEPAMPAKMADLWRRWSCTHLNDPANPNSGFVAPLAELAAWGGPTPRPATLESNQVDRARSRNRGRDSLEVAVAAGRLARVRGARSPADAERSRSC